MVGLPVAVFLHNRFSGSPRLLSLLPPAGGCPPRPFGGRVLSFGSAGWLAGWLAPAAGLTARSFFGTAYISRNVGNVHAPARERVQLAGGLYLNNIHELRYTRQIYCPGTRGFCGDLEPAFPPSPPPPSFPSHATFLALRFLRFSRPRPITPPRPGTPRNQPPPSPPGSVLLVDEHSTARKLRGGVWQSRAKGCDSEDGGAEG